MLSGQTAPGADGKTFHTVTQPVINNKGQVALLAYVATGDSANPYEGWLLGGPVGDIAVAARPGMPLPGLNVPWGQISIYNYAVNDAGLFGASGQLADGRDVGVVGPLGSLQPVLLAGQSIPGDGGMSVQGVTLGRLRNDGTAGFSAGLSSGTTTATAFGWVSGNNPTIVLRTGTDVPGVTPSTQFLGPGYHAGGIDGPDASGNFYFALPYRNLGFGNYGGKGLFMVSGGSVTQIASPTDLTISQIVMNSHGRLAFAAGAPDVQTHSETLTQIFAGLPGAFNLVASQGGPVPGMPGAVFSDFDNPVLGEGGQVLFKARANGVTGLWEAAPGSGVKLIAYDGEPGTGLGQLTSIFTAEGINVSGQVVFTDGRAEFAQAIWATDPSGTLVRVASVGDQIDIGGGVLKTVASLSMAQNNSGQYGSVGAPWFNDVGQIAFGAAFTDGSSGAFITAVPEPAAAMLLLPLALILIRSRRGYSG